MFRLVIDDVFDATRNNSGALHVRVLAGTVGLLFPPTVVAGNHKIQSMVSSPNNTSRIAASDEI
jgi:hypothetical protein